MIILLLSFSSVAAKNINSARDKELSVLDGVIGYVTSSWIPITCTAVVVGWVFWRSRTNNHGLAPAVGVYAGAVAPNVNDLRKKFLDRLPQPPFQPPVERGAQVGSGVLGDVGSILARRATEAKAAEQATESRRANARSEAVATFRNFAREFREAQQKNAFAKEINYRRDALVMFLLIDAEATDANVDIVALEEFWDLFVQDGHLFIAKLTKKDFSRAVQFLVDHRRKDVALACLEKLQSDIATCFRILPEADNAELYSLAAKLKCIGEAKRALGL